MVAMRGWIMPTPLAMPETVTVTGEARAPLATASLKGYRFPDYTRGLAAAVAPLRAQFEAAPDAYRVVGFGFGVFERAGMLRGFENFFMDLIEAPAFVEEVLDAIVEQQVKLIDELVKLPVDGIIFSDDFGDQRGADCRFLTGSSVRDFC